MIMILMISARVVPTGTYLQATSASMGTTDLLYTRFHRKQLYILGQNANLYFLLVLLCTGFHIRRLIFGSKCQLIFSTFISNVDIFPHCPHYEGLVAIFRPRVTFINRWWLFDLVLFTSSIMIQDHYFHHLHCTYFSTFLHHLTVS